jgi:hypothetical protein
MSINALLRQKRYQVCYRSLLLTAVLKPQCKHIFFGASGPDPYIEVLRTHEEYHHKVTLIRGNKIDTQEALCLKMVSLSCIHSYKYHEVAANHEEVEPMEDLESSSSAEQNHVSLPNR